jgi:hypothetical protein
MSDNKIVMRSKAVFSIIAFLAAFGISVAVTPRASNSIVAPYVKRSCAETATARKITNLLSQDIDNGRLRDEKINSFGRDDMSRRAYLVNFTIVINQYADASASIDDSDLPRDFKAAWRDHMRAWQKHSSFLERVSDSSARVPDSNFSLAFTEQNKEISETWFEVLRIARKYDAYIPAGAY